MKKFNQKCCAMLGVCFYLVSGQVQAQWTEFLTISRIEVHESGVFLVAPIAAGLTKPGCDSTKTYDYVQFANGDPLMSDRALSTAYYVQASEKKMRVSIVRCEGNYPIATGFWVE